VEEPLLPARLFYLLIAMAYRAAPPSALPGISPTRREITSGLNFLTIYRLVGR